MKLKNLKITIISSAILLFPLLSYAKNVTEQGKSYFIITEVEKIHRTTDMHRAMLKAKGQLARYLDPKEKSVIIEMKHFQFINKRDYAEKSVYRFKIDKQNVKLIK